MPGATVKSWFLNNWGITTTPTFQPGGADWKPSKRPRLKTVSDDESALAVVLIRMLRRHRTK